ncbi:PREDICTED: xanthine dehydrogenase-like [Atta cephalotes]|uniref:Aldehyde oxidase/xanthine dehydrogenase a/b hammerhead domain-containing protein n=1 Tax=Atta cephalotes TaxID=12957 RepID=A0A158NL95_ATTCE|nr:PREDICTED: xanthine dehydrogenase-like [Atta cephalotes]
MVSSDSIPIRMSLLFYIREYVGLRGTKAMCHEGGCGACIVSVTYKDKTIAVNSCLVPVLICQGWNIFTIESLGNKQNGYHKIQAVLAHKNGSQCGYCSPGMVMNMYTLTLQSSNISIQQIENSFGGNICRCTGYRAILDAFKGFATDAPPSMVKDIQDIEELYKIKPCRKNRMSCVRSYYDKQSSDEKKMLSIKRNENVHFYRVLSIEDLFAVFKEDPLASYTLNGGNTAEGKQNYITHVDLWPINEPMPKLESLKQTSGEAQYCDDLLPFPREVFCAFVVTNVGNGEICGIDASWALQKEGVVAFFSAQDIPGKNLCISAASKLMSLPEDELLFAEKDILYAGQPVGVIVAETHNVANEAAKLIEITYSERMKNPVISIEDALDVGDETRIRQSIKIPAKRKGNDIEHVLKGVFQSGGQYHYPIETQFCVCVPVEGGMDVYPSSQWMDLIQVSIANCLNVQNNSINVHVRRLGGSYGSKISRNAQISCACALVCHKLNRPARFIMTIESNMQSIGKRCSARQEYDIVVNNEGVIQYLISNQWSNCGSSFNEPQAELVTFYMQRSCYLTDTWKFNGFDVRTDLPSNTFCRASGSTEAVAIMENIMEHIAKVTKKDPIEVRLANMNDMDKSVLETMIKDLSNLINYNVNKESIDDFNFHNRWKKKGIAMIPMKYLITYEGQFEAIVSVCARDGSVCVTHSGIEIDQGINTKIVQLTACTLNIDIKLISVKQSNNLATSNKSTTGHSITTESCEYATIQACTQILERLEPIRKKMKNPTWKDLIFKAYEEGISLYARYMLMTGPTQAKTKPYAVYGVTSAEVEIDLLTGQHIIRRVDLMIDTGLSMNPKIDVGQVEGAFVMGIGYWTSEDLVYAPDTGKLITDRTWNYKPPGAKDIPEDFRVYLCKNSYNEVVVYGSKAIDEAPLCMSYVIPIAFRYALNSARAEVGMKEEWYQLNGPCTTERVLLTSLTSRDKMVI